uniref:Uncharacterized protein n=1 Tax=Anguilla anguilla TaxID=7936 RepID=A0A0E9W557_ANGAN
MDAGIEMRRDKRDETGIALNSNESEKQMTGEEGGIGLKQRPFNDAILSQSPSMVKHRERRERMIRTRQLP